MLGVAPAVAADEADPSVATLEEVAGDAFHVDIGADGDTVHLVWQHGQFKGPRQIYYQRITRGAAIGSANPGPSGAVLDLSATETVSSAPAIAIAGLSVHVVWVERAYTKDPMLMYRRSDDAGRTWDDPVLLAIPDGDWWSSVNPKITVVDRDVHVVYAESLGLRYLRSHDRGGTWERPVVVGETGADIRNPVVIENGSSITVAWRERGDERTYERDELGYVRGSSTEDGVAWSEPFQIAEFSGWYPRSRSLLPELAASNGVLHATWETEGERIPLPNGRAVRSFDVMYRRSLDGGVTWQDPMQLTDGVARTRPTLTVSGDDVQIVVEGDDLILLRSRDQGGTWDEPFVWSAPQVGALETVSSDLGIHVVYRDRPEGQGEGALSYAHVDLGFDPPPGRWRHIGVA
jgi:hypothetical protein